MAEKAHVKIESAAFKGYGVARLEGKVVFIPYSVVGDEGWVEMIEEKKNYAIGRWSEILVASPSRVEPRCLYFGTCGGCHWQHIDYGQQVKLKEAVLQDILMRLGKMGKIPSVTPFPSPDPYDYRTRLQLKVKRERFGFYQERSHQLVDIERCPIAHPLINQIISLLRKERALLSFAEGIDISVSPEEGKAVLMFHSPEPSRGWEVSLHPFLQSHPTLKGISIFSKRRTASLGNPCLSFTIPLNLTLRVSPGSFFQVNPKQNEKLIEKVLEFSSGTDKENTLDLYSGVGNLTLPLASISREVVGIEENAAAIADARFNAQFNEIETVRFIRGKVEDVLKNWKRKKPDLVILDPPRTGAKGVVGFVAEFRPKRVVYVSCEPTLLARDLRLFAERGYSLRKLALIDMFPQTYHIEVVGLLTQS
ncbi:MAG: 23S rRNA (uracil(1939)-C(5))-methyltransferase RlmD [Thermodesulfobacteriota bacterium]